MTAAPATDFLARLAARAVGEEPVVRPRLAARFEQASEAADEPAPVLADAGSPVAVPPALEAPAISAKAAEIGPEIVPQRAPVREVRNESAESARAQIRLPEPPQTRGPAPFAASAPIFEVPAPRAAIAAMTAASPSASSQPPIVTAAQIVEPPARVIERIIVQPVAAAQPARPVTERAVSPEVRAPQAVLTPAPARSEVLPAPSPPAPPETIVNITIGRIEIRAPAQPPAAAPARARPRPTAQSLDDYLRARAGQRAEGA